MRLYVTAAVVICALDVACSFFNDEKAPVPILARRLDRLTTLAFALWGIGVLMRGTP